MLCQSCGKKEASFHYTSNENGKVTELHLCHDCAAKKGFLDENFKNFNPFAFLENNENMIGELLGGMLGSKNTGSLKEAAVCPFCGMRLNEFMHGGKAGCAKCYTTFKDAITPTVKKLHGNTAHTGKFPKGRAEAHSKKVRREELEALLKRAIETQEYEKAAEYRDAIKALDAEATAESAKVLPENAQNESPVSKETPEKNEPNGENSANA